MNKDKRNARSIGDINNDGVTGHSTGTTTRANWITENLGKTIIIIIGVIIIFSISLALTADNGSDNSNSQAPQPGENGDR